MSTQQEQSFLVSVRTNYLDQLRAALVGYLTRIKWPRILTGVGLFALFVALFANIQFATPDLAGNDGYYHIKIAQVMRLEGLRPPFPWLPLTVLSPEAYVDHHFLYHVFLIPFTFGDLREGAKWASVILPALAFLSGWVLLQGQRVPYAALWAIGLFAVSEAFLYRMSMPRTQSVSLLMLLLGLHFVLTQRYRWLFVLSFIYVWLYDAFPLMIALVGAYVAVRWLLEGKLNLAPLVYSSLGIAVGLIINPYFPDNLLFIYHHLLPKLTDATSTNVGREWYPYNTTTLIENSGFALLAFVAGIIALGLRDKRMGTATGTMLALALLFAAMLFQSRRFIEYFPAFALLFCAFAWAPFFRDWLKNYDWAKQILPQGMVIVIILAVVWNVQDTQDSLRGSSPYERYADASAWLAANTPENSLVFQTDWDDFTRLYFYNTHNTYTLGLDPTYMQSYDPELYDLWVDITQGEVEAPAETIAGVFGAEYVMTDLNHGDFLREAEADPRLEEVYRDDYAALFRVLAPQAADAQTAGE